MVRWVVFDMMGVLFKDRDDVASCLHPFIMSKEVFLPLDKVLEHYLPASIGRMTSRQLWENFGLPDCDSEYLLNLRFDADALSMAERLPEKFKFGIISNDIAEWSSHLRKIHGIDRVCTHAIISGDVGIRKPDPRIFKLFLARVKAKPEECIFIDDITGNIDAASKLGFHTILYTGNYQNEEHSYTGTSAKTWSEVEAIILKL
jgi:putative hydrolase of the HAD superfamily